MLVYSVYFQDILSRYTYNLPLLVLRTNVKVDIFTTNRYNVENTIGYNKTYQRIFLNAYLVLVCLICIDYLTYRLVSQYPNYSKY